MKTYLFGHVNEQTALRIENYPWGFRLKTSIFYWIETEPKKGDRFCSMTIDPKTGRKCKPKKSTYCNVGAMFRNEENGHIGWNGITPYSNAVERNAFIEAIGGKEVLNSEQLIQWRQLNGEKIVKVNEFTGENKKDFAIKWGKNSAGELIDVSITFDRPDGVSPREMFEAIKTINQDRLNELFTPRPSKWEASGFSVGFVRIKIRGGFQLVTVSATEYKEYLASDHSTKE